ncbi:MAG: UDP-N-acetylglucosamine 2-epimerase (non-hydrolyzing) [Cytophagales bacterium]
MKKRVLTVVGTRPNIIKITQFQKVADSTDSIQHFLVHTGQHFSHNMNDVFFEELSLPNPHFSFETDRSSVVIQLAETMKGLEKVVNECNPDILLAVGDVNSTLAASLVANKMNIKLGHVESGLRSFDRSMPEEHNRLVTDVLADFYFVTEQNGYDNLLKEGKNRDSLFFVGNTMIDTLIAYDPKIKTSRILEKVKLSPQNYVLLTMHRPGNVDTKEGLVKLLEIMEAIAKNKSIVFPIHPRTLKNIEHFGLKYRLDTCPNVVLLEPTGYLDFQNLILNCAFVITDSGGIQEETTFRQIPCITLRPNTERPITSQIGSNTLCEYDTQKVLELVKQIENGIYKKGEIPPLWDGKSTERIFEILKGISPN